MSLTSTQLTLQIDSLLEQYLHLLNQYDTLRKKLSVLQASTLQNIARANFSAPRGTRYGQDHYSSHMTAIHCLTITISPSTSNIPSFALSSPAPPTSSSSNLPTTPTSPTRDSENQTSPLTPDNANPTSPPTPDNQDKNHAEKVKPPPQPKKMDPLAQFGLLSLPTSLRTAQREAEGMLEIVPQLVSVDAQMKEVEIQIRRARKWRGKAEIAEATEKEKEMRGEVEELQWIQGEVVGVN